MKTKTLNMFIRIAGLVLLVLGVLFWLEIAENLVLVHIVLGSLLALSLLGLVYKAYKLGINRVLVIVSLRWALALPAFGLIQKNLLDNSLHWIISVLHLLCALGAIGLAEILSSKISKLEN